MRKGAPFVWKDRQQAAFEALKACLISAPILGFPTEDGRFLLDTDASLYAVSGVLKQIQRDREVVIAYAGRSLRLSQRRYCTTHRKMLAAVVMCTHFRSYLQGAQFTLRIDHSSLRWLKKFRNGDGMLARWYMVLGQFSITFEYRPGAQHANADGMSRQCGQCLRPDCLVSVRNVRNGPLHGRGFVAGAVWGNLGGSHVAGGTYSRFATSCSRSGPYCDISAGCNFDNCS